MKIKEYAISKTAVKTAKENGLILAEDGKRLFDFSLLEDIPTYKWIKENMKEDALKNVSPANRTSFCGTQYDEFSAYDGIAEYYKHNVYSAKTGNKLFTIYQLAKVNFHEYERKTVYEKLKISGTIEASCGYYPPMQDIEI